MSFRWRLIGALVLTALCAAVGTYLLASRTIADRFDAFRVQMRQADTQDMARLLGQYWEARGSWEGVDQYFRARLTVWVQGQVVYQESRLGEYMLVDNEGRVVACGYEPFLGHHLAMDDSLRERTQRYGHPVMAGGERVGTLVPLDTVDHSPLEMDFLASVRRATLIGGAIALAVAAVLGTLLATQLSAPLRRLMLATDRIARGDLAHRVALRSRDEIGRLARAMNRMVEALQRSENARRRLLTDVAHELRTPLTVIQGNLEAMLDGVFPVTPDNLSPVYEETLHLGGLIEDLRDLTLAESGKLALNLEAIDLGPVAENACEALRPTAAEQGIRLDVTAEQDLWVRADRRRVRQVLGNVLSNALRFSPEGSTVSVQVRHAGDEVLMSISDQGPGIPHDEIDQVFERFYKGDAARSGHGTGLGLAIAREIVAAHDGRIWVESSPGRGAAFHIALPTVAAPAEPL